MMQNVVRTIKGPWVPPHMGKAPYLWSMSLMFFMWKYFYIRPSGAELLCLFATVCVFLPMYFASYWVRGSLSLLLIALSCLLGVLWAPQNFGATTFFIFACGMCAGVLPERRAYTVVALVILCAVATAFVLDTPPLSFVLPTVIVGIPVGLAGIMDANVRRSRQSLLRKQEEVEHLATIAERERISRDLHDLLGHTLSLITLKAELAGKLIGRDLDACRQEVKDIENSARHALSEVRSAITGYRSTGFAHELESARACLAAAQVELSATVQPIVLPAAAENVMSLALREAVTNIVRHAGATRCEVRLTLESNMIVFRIADNGASVPNAAALRQGNGLTGMRERVAALGGRFALVVESGLALELRLPMGAPA